MKQTTCIDAVGQPMTRAAARQVPGARTGPADDIGLGGAAVVTVLRR